VISLSENEISFFVVVVVVVEGSDYYQQAAVINKLKCGAVLTMSQNFHT
jgi:hypothetical protein